MGLLKKLFGGKKESQSTLTSQDISIDRMKVELPKIKRNIYDFFEIDLKNVPDETFIKAEVGTNTCGQTVENYRKTLDYKECGIFDTIEIKVIAGKSKNVSLKSFEPEKVKMDYLKKLIDDLYLIHGYDRRNRGKFTNSDIEYYHSNDFYMLFGRTWDIFSKYEFPVTVGRDKDEVSISIWGVDTIE